MQAAGNDHLGSRGTRETQERVRVTLGVDTHADVHVGVALDQAGRRLGERTVPTTPEGYAALAAWASRLGALGQVGIEGTGSYGAGLARWLHARGVAVVEVERPRRRDRQGRRRVGKSDPIDAEAAARAVQAGTALGEPKAGDGEVEAIRTLRLARRAAVKARTQAATQLRALVVTAPDALRARLHGLPLSGLVAAAAAFRVPAPATPATPAPGPAAATKLTLRSLARRHRHLTAEVEALDAHLAHWRSAPPRPLQPSSPSRVSAQKRPPHCSPRSATTPSGCAARPRSPACAGWPRCPPRRARRRATA